MKKSKIAQAEKNMPVLMAIQKDFAKRKPLDGLKIGACLHLTKETAVLLLTLQAGGAKVFACPSNPLTTQDDVVAELKKRGIRAYGFRGINKKHYRQYLNAVATIRPDIVIDDGADLTDVIHKVTYMDGFVPMGGLEETTTGVQRIRHMSLKYPIIAVNDTPTKHLFDNVYGTGQSTFDGIIRATNVLVAGKTVVVAGYGHCGKGVCQRAKGLGAKVVVTEIDPVKALQAYMDGFDVFPMDLASSLGDIFITVTGNRDVITAEHMEYMKPGAILANAGHFDVEIDVEAAKKFPVRLLAEGRLVNLVEAEGHPSEVMDMSFANQALCAEWLTQGNTSAIGVLDVPAEIDRKVALMKLETLNLTIDELTDAQREYLCA